MSRPLISCGRTGANPPSRSTCGLSRGRSTISALPRPAGDRAAVADHHGKHQNHPNTPENQSWGAGYPRSSRARHTGSQTSVAMAELPANSAGVEVDRSPPTRVRVMLPLPLPEALDYLPPDGATPPKPGSFARVGLGSRRLIGVVWEEGGGELPPERLKPVLDILPTPPLRPEMRRFVERVAAYTLPPPGMVLRMAMSVEEALLPRPPRRVCVITEAGLAALEDAAAGPKLTAARRRVLQALRNEGACSMAELARRAGCSAGVVRGLIAAGHIGEEFVSGEPAPEPMPDWR